MKLLALASLMAVLFTAHMTMAARAAKSGAGIIAALKDGLRIASKHDEVMEAADASMVSGAVCGSSTPCWPIIGEAVDVFGDDNRKLRSQGGKSVVKYLAKGATAYESRPVPAHLFRTSLLDGPLIIDPGSFFFAYVWQGKLVAVTPPARVSGHNLPAL
jgi:hypothetical protein